MVISIFCIGDLHLSLSVDKPMDIFKGWDNYTERIEKNWQISVTENDVVVIPGDVSWGLKLEETLEDFKFLNSLPGKKVIIKGNHDLWWNSMTKMTKFLNENELDSISFVHNSCYPVGEYAVCGSRGWFFETEGHSKKIILREAGRLEASISSAEELGLKPLVFLHYPPAWNNDVCFELLEVLKKHKIDEVWHGHIHGHQKDFANYSAEGIKFHLISCDCLNFSPRLIK